MPLYRLMRKFQVMIELDYGSAFVWGESKEEVQTFFEEATDEDLNDFNYQPSRFVSVQEVKTPDDKVRHGVVSDGKWVDALYHEDEPIIPTSDPERIPLGQLATNDRQDLLEKQGQKRMPW